jgi:hypothetical protein
MLMGLAAWPTSAMEQAGSRDKAAERNIENAVGKRHAAGDHEGAESLLLATLEMCADECSPAMMARLWMHSGRASWGGGIRIPC